MDRNQHPMHDYQIYAKDFIKAHPKCGLFLDMGLGKAVDDETVIPTPDGFRRVGDIQIGDSVFTMDGTATRVLQVFKHTNKTAYKVTLADGRSFVCCDEHLIPIAALQNTQNIRPVPLKDLLDAWNADGLYHYAIPRNKIVYYPKQPLIISPQTMGLILSYGRFENDELTIADDTETRHIMRRFADRLGPMERNAEGRWYFLDQRPAQPLYEALRAFGFESGKPMDFIPAPYHIDAALGRRDLLLGLLGVEIDDLVYYNKTWKFELEVAGEQMARDIQSIVWSMGFACKSKYRPRKKTYQIEMRLTSILPDETLQDPTFFGSTIRITDIQPVASRNMTCFTVADHTHTYLINDYIVTHNTRITLEALYELNPKGHVLIVAPKNIARSTWMDEIKKWEFPFRVQSLIVNHRGNKLSKKKRLAIYESVQTAPPTVYFINREMLPDLIANMPVVNGHPVWYFPNIIIDELQSFKNYRSERFKNMKYVMPCVERLIGLTGTPMPEGLMDLWAEVYLMDGGERLGKTITSYRNEYFLPGLYVNGYPVSWIPKPGAEETIYGLISDLVISIRNHNLQLPPVTYNNLYVDMDADQKKRYKTMMRDMVYEGELGKAIAKNRAVLQGRLSQMASGAIYVGDNKQYEVIHENKLDACEYIIENSSGSVLIAYRFQSDLDMLLKRFPQAVKFDGSPDMVHAWNDQKIPVLLIQPASAGHGLNLQDGGHTMIWYTLPSSLEEYLQANARLARQGQKNPVVIHHILTRGTIDDRILNALQQKDMREQRLLDAVRAAIQTALDDTPVDMTDNTVDEDIDYGDPSEDI